MTYNRYQDMLETSSLVPPAPRQSTGQSLYASYVKRGVDLLAAVLLLLATFPITLPLILFILITAVSYTHLTLPTTPYV